MLNRFLPRDKYDFLYLMTVLSMVFVPWIPELTSISSIIFVVFFITSLLCWAGQRIRENSINLIELQFAILFLLLILNLFVATHNGVIIASWIRSVIPVFVLFYTLFLIRFIDSSRVLFILDVFLFSSLLWTVLVVLRGDISLYSVMLSSGRITGIDQNFSIPYPLLGALIVLYFKNYSVILRILLFLGFSWVVVLTGYKAQIFILLLNLMIFSLFELSRALKLALLLIITFVSFYFFVDFKESTIVAYVLARFESVGGSGDSVRIFEIQEAISIFKEHPIFGGGLGLEFLAESGSVDVKNYIHNSVFYYLATTGLLGLLALLLIITQGFFSASDYRVKIIFLSLLATTLTAASYKLVHFNFFLAIVLALLFISNKHKEKADL